MESVQVMEGLMRATKAIRHIALTSGLALCALGTGCDLLDLDGEGETLVQVFSTHHASPEDGIHPDRGGQGEDRVFETDEGWTVMLESGYITTSGVTLHECEGGSTPIDLFWGDVAEDLNQTDLGLSTVGSLEVGPSEFCSVTVHYAPFQESAPEVRPRAAEAEGATVWLSGVAGKDDVWVEFSIRATQAVDVRLDLRPGNGGQPLRITGEENFPVELTLSKTYDRFFDGIDFAAMGELDMKAQSLAVLELETRVAPGTIVLPH
jgi:hypothetical protein